MVLLRCLPILPTLLLIGGVGMARLPAMEQRDEVFRGHAWYNEAFAWRHPAAYRSGAALHIAHGAQHDILLCRGDADPAMVDRAAAARFRAAIADPPCTEPTQEYEAPYTARTMWRLLRTIEWTHVLHEETYDILAARSVPWSAMGAEIDRAVDHYLRANDVALSCAPLELTMRRAGVMMRPYFTDFRTDYPASNAVFYAAHWWHPAVYEAMLLGGPGDGQEQVVIAVEATFRAVLADPPQRMLLSRELMPRYARLAPASANIFDNLHMLHGIVYDILAYPGWTVAQKHDEVYRVLRAMSYRAGDERWVRRFPLPHPDVDPRQYEPWMRDGPGEMGRIMLAMHAEMHPPGQTPQEREMHARMEDLLRQKLLPGRSGQEPNGAFMDALMQAMPDMPMAHGHTGPGEDDPAMSERMCAAWEKAAAQMPDVPPLPMPAAEVRP